MQTKSSIARRDAHRVHARREHSVSLDQRLDSQRSTIKDRMQSCMAQDRLEELAAGMGSPSSISADSFRNDLLEQRMLLLNAVSEDTELIRSSLDLCKKISRHLGVKERFLDLNQ